MDDGQLKKDSVALVVQEATAGYQLSVGNALLLQPRYKQTEVGVIPEDWDVISASDACSKIQDGTHFSPKTSGNDYFYVTSKNIRFGYLDMSTASRIDAAQHQAIYRRCDVKKGDVLLTKDGANTGNAALNTINEEFSLLSSVAFLRFEQRKHCAAYFLQQILTSQGQRQIQEAMAGNAITRLTLQKINKLRFPVPPTKAEQEAIAEVLSDMDALIESLEQLVAKKRHIKQGAMQELLTGKKRLPGVSEEWKMKQLRNVAEICSGGTPSTSEPEFWDGDILWSTPTDITALNGFKYLTHTARTITTQGLKSSSADLIPAHSVVMTSRATIGECAINTVPMTTNQGFKNFIPFQDTDVEFLYYLLQTKKQDFISLCGGSTFLEISKTQLAVFEIGLPKEKTEQTAIAAILSDMDAEIAVLEEKLAKTRALKQGMMHNLLTGKIRLIDPVAVKIEQHALSDVESIPATPKPDKSHNWAFNEAVVISVLADLFGKSDFPLGRKRYTKLSYLMHRKAEQEAQGYLKKAAGPYNPKTKYAGPEKIAQAHGYMRQHEHGKYKGFIAAEKIEQAKTYFVKWYGPEIIAWLRQFRYRSNDDLECLATVDMAMQELLKQGKAADVNSIRALIASEPEWLPKLERSVFSDAGIAAAIEECRAFFTI